MAAYGRHGGSVQRGTQGNDREPHVGARHAGMIGHQRARKITKTLSGAGLTGSWRVWRPRRGASCGRFDCFHICAFTMYRLTDPVRCLTGFVRCSPRSKAATRENTTANLAEHAGRRISKLQRNEPSPTKAQHRQVGFDFAQIADRYEPIRVAPRHEAAVWSKRVANGTRQGPGWNP